MADIRAPGRTRRQTLRDLLAREERSFETLRQELQLPVHVLEEDLHHLERSLRRGAERLRVTEPRCLACGFVFRNRAPKRFSTPSRCPRCRSERVLPARLRVAGPG